MVLPSRAAKHSQSRLTMATMSADIAAASRLFEVAFKAAAVAAKFTDPPTYDAARDAATCAHLHKVGKRTCWFVQSIPS